MALAELNWSRVFGEYFSQSDTAQIEHSDHGAKKEWNKLQAMSLRFDSREPARIHLSLACFTELNDLIQCSLVRLSVV